MSPGKRETQRSKQREIVQVRLPDNQALSAPAGTPLSKFLSTAYPDKDNPPMAAIVDNRLRELGWIVTKDVQVDPIFLSDSDGIRIYRRTLSFLLVVATEVLFPDVHLYIDYSVPHGGYFCHLRGRPPFTVSELQEISNKMSALVNQDLPIERKLLSIDQAKQVFKERGEMGKVALLTHAPTDHTHLYKLEGILDYFHGYMLPSTGCLRVFALEQFGHGFVLRFPRRMQPTKLQPPQRFVVLRTVFDEYGEWLNLLGIRNVASLNRAIRQGDHKQIVLVSEALHERRITEIADQLTNQHDKQNRIVCISGPSSSGKTTFSKRLSIQLLAQGIRPYPLELDNYFLPRNQMRSDEKGDINFEAIEALDTDLLQQHVHQLLAGKKIMLPRYDFQSGTRKQGSTVTLKDDSILLLEGIHALNPRLWKNSEGQSAFRIFVSALTQLNLDDHNRVPTTDTRLIRRIVRDSIYRGYTTEQTIDLWESVRRGEKQNIFPYQEQADMMFNSALVYELAVLKPYIEPLLSQVSNVCQQTEAKRLLALLRWFRPCPPDTVPSNSILREFIGDSALRGFVPH